jgi:hypothetical protein
MRPIKISNLVSFDIDKLKDYIRNLEWDLKKLYTQFSSLISFNSVQIGDSSNYVSIDSSGTLRLNGEATVWDDLRNPVTTTKLGSNSLPHFDETNVGYLFPKNDAAEILYGVCQFPHSYKLGSRVYPHVHWVQGMSSKANYYIDYKWINLVGSTTGSFTTYAMLSTEYAWASNTTFHQLSTNTAGILGTGITSVSSIFLFKLYRNDNDYAGDALTYEFDIHYEMDSLGSNTEYSK